MYTCIWSPVCIYVYMYTYICIYLYVYVYIMYTCIYIYVDVYIYTYVYVYLCVCIYMYVHVYIHIHMYVYTCIYSYWSCEQEFCHACKSHVAHMHASCSDIWMRHVTYRRGTFDTCDTHTHMDTSCQIWTSHVTHMNESGHMQISHVIHMNTPTRSARQSHLTLWCPPPQFPPSNRTPFIMTHTNIHKWMHIQTGIYSHPPLCRPSDPI